MNRLDKAQWTGWAMLSVFCIGFILGAVIG